MKYTLILKYYEEDAQCPECGKNTLTSTNAGDSCSNCGYFQFYG